MGRSQVNARSEQHGGKQPGGGGGVSQKPVLVRCDGTGATQRSGQQSLATVTDSRRTTVSRTSGRLAVVSVKNKKQNKVGFGRYSVSHFLKNDITSWHTAHI